MISSCDDICSMKAPEVFEQNLLKLMIQRQEMDFPKRDVIFKLKTGKNFEIFVILRYQKNLFVF